MNIEFMISKKIRTRGRFFICILVPLIMLVSACSTINRQQSNWDTVKSVFVSANDTIQTSTYWYWISDHLSKEGVVEDLKAMKRVGINRAFIGNIGLEEIPQSQWGSVKIFSEEWWDILHTALKTASELDIEIGIFNSPGWSQSGGPWVKESQAMRYLHSVDTVVRGNHIFRGAIGTKPTNFQSLHALAFKVPSDYHVTLANAKPAIHSTWTDQNYSYLLDGNINTVMDIPKSGNTAITFYTDKELTVRNLTIHPAHRRMAFSVVLEAELNGEFERIKSFRIDRMNTALNVGFDPYAAVSIAFDAISAQRFRLRFEDVHGDAAVADIEMNALPKVGRYKEKSLAKMHPTPLPYWGDYLWDNPVKLDESAQVITPDSVIVLTDLVKEDGTLEWKVPAGEWLIMHAGMVPTGVTNMPTSKEGRGLEVDKMSSKHVVAHFDGFLGEIMRRVPAEDRTTFKIAVQDSYETGGQNWTDDFEDGFKEAFGYDPIPFIPVLSGYVIGGQDQSDRFLWDLRRHVANQIAYEYVGGLRKVSRKHGLRTWLENYGHWGFPGEFLQYGGQSDEIGGEFWSEGELGDIENRAASSSAHIYGKNKVFAESFTAAHQAFGRYPAQGKARADRFFAEGINSTLLHVYIHQPYEDRKPGVNAWFGTEFNRFNTWFFEMKGFMHYLKRCNFLLQQGRYVADVAYFIGEDTPKMTGVQDPPIPHGYSFDYMNAEVILHYMTLQNGRFTLPDGLSYKILVLPDLETITPEVLRKIEMLVYDGGVILGPKPLRSPSLKNFPQADTDVQELADKLWGNIEPTKIGKNSYGKGMVLQGMSLEEALSLVAVKPDLTVSKPDAIAYIHRTHPQGEIYFLSNQTSERVDFDAQFRVDQGHPEIWDPLSGEMRSLPVFSHDSGVTNVPLKLASNSSIFVVFPNDIKAALQDEAKKSNYPEPVKTFRMEDGWDVAFMDGDSILFEQRFEKLVDWATHPDDRVRFFSGSAVYKAILPSIDELKDKKIKLDLGQAAIVASVKVNGQEVGSLWTAPYKLDITPYCVGDKNTVEISVTNTWVNALIGDQRLPEKDRKLWSIVNPYTKDSTLQSSGLLGPVVVEVYQNEQ